MESANGDVAGNLARAGRWSEAAARRGAELILLPELFSTGFELNDRSWQSAEPQGGPSERWLLDTARRHGCHIGGSYLEARGEDFFNTFALAAPDGSIAGRVRKSHPCSIEAYVFKARRRPARDRHGTLPHRRRHLLRREPTGGMGQDPGRRS
jgi:N-carbamoylputrescine amidase